MSITRLGWASIALVATLTAPVVAQPPPPPPPAPPAPAPPAPPPGEEAPGYGTYAPEQPPPSATYQPQGVPTYAPPPVTQPPPPPPSHMPKVIESFDPSQPPPAGYTMVRKRRIGLIIAGGITLGVTYGWTVSIGTVASYLEADETNTKLDYPYLRIPVLGPFLQLPTIESSLGKSAAVASGLIQGAGAAMLIYGLTVPKHLLIRNDLLSLHVAPMYGDGTSGLMAVGTF